ncbi:hypothetical protein C8024_13195 [Sphingopyxis sp. BSNA05]|uniref:sensor domain-containing protein n=1 Tax=Sphingopyxis sp. BSNA05 TaxID=1236614 RepID=UPI0015651394|nr:EAL domain-containing protein [Sphingopyxis sp. BSNA05]NRD90211.1 hypothetical protein [Sphingopyxis sp. BSNA05]
MLLRLGQQVVELLEARQLREIGRISKLVNDTLNDAIILSDAAGNITYCNPAAEHIFGCSSAHLSGQPLRSLLSEVDHPMIDIEQANAAAGKESALADQPVEVCARRRCGEEFPAELSMARWNSADVDQKKGFVAVVRDISRRKRLEIERQRSETFLNAVVENLPSMLFVKNAETRVYEMFNRAAEEMTGRRREEVIGYTDRQIFPDRGKAYRRREDRVVKTGKISVFENDFEGADGKMHRIRTKRVLVDGVDRSSFILGITDDITVRHLAKQKIAHLALHDSLTGLRNRAGIARDFEELWNGPVKEPTAVLVIDLDRFKVVNDLYGHPIGDELLSQIAGRIVELLPSRAAAGRMGADEFLVIIPGRNSNHRAARFARALIEAFSDPFSIEGEKIHIGVSIGLSMSNRDGDDFESLCQSADRALSRAKATGRGKFCFFDPLMDAAVTDRRELEKDLRVAMAADQIKIHFQPLASLATGQIESFEALARWDHPERGAVKPETFIAVAEESGLIVELGARILDMAISEAARWDRPLRVAVNLSPAQFQNDNLLSVVSDVLEKYAFDPTRLELEITENFLIRDTRKAMETLNQLQKLGVKIAMDDFGTGYSSLSYLQMFAFDKVKIDRSFIQDMTDNPQSLTIVQAIIGLGKGLNLPVVAEGVETEEQLAALRHEGCSMVQGFGIGRPEPIECFYGLVMNPVPAGLIRRQTAA